MATVSRVRAITAGWARVASASSSSPPTAASRALSSQSLQQQSPEHPRSSSGSPPTAGGSSSPSVLSELDDAALVGLLVRGGISAHRLEEDLGDPFRAVHLRRLYTAAELRRSAPERRTAGDVASALQGIPEQHFDAPAFYKTVLNTNCEAVIGACRRGAAAGLARQLRSETRAPHLACAPLARAHAPPRAPQATSPTRWASWAPCPSTAATTAFPWQRPRAR